MIAGVEPLDQATKARLELIAGADWHFADAKTQTGVLSIHPYPAKFIPQIPRQLIEFLADGPGVRVFDPFCGSGTTLVEAQAAGLPSIGVDLNPIATLIAGSKTRLGSAPVSTLAADICRVARATPVRAPGARNHAQSPPHEADVEPSQPPDCPRQT